MDQIIIHNLQVYGYHGCAPEERTLGQPFEVDLRLNADLKKAGQTDALTATIDYSKICLAVSQFAQSQRYYLLEALAENICKLLFDSFPLIEAIVIEIRKPKAPIPAHFNSIGIVLSRKRHD
jgi:dihydroneopterin aldolase